MVILTEGIIGVYHDVHYEFRGYVIGTFVPDLVVNELVLVEIKSRPSIEAGHVAHVINYLRASSLEVGLLLNFGPTQEMERLICTNDRQTTRTRPKGTSE